MQPDPGPPDAVTVGADGPGPLFDFWPERCADAPDR